MKAPQGFWVLVAAVIAVHLVFTAWVAAMPTRDEWYLYVDDEVPAAVASTTSNQQVQANLEAAGYAVTIEDHDWGTVLTATVGNAPRLHLAFHGLDGGQGAWVASEVLCPTGYLRGGCPQDAEAQLRGFLARGVADAGLTVDLADAHFGDNDFAAFDEFALALLHIFLGIFSAGILVAGAMQWVSAARVERLLAAQRPLAGQNDEARNNV